MTLTCGRVRGKPSRMKPLEHSGLRARGVAVTNGKVVSHGKAGVERERSKGWLRSGRCSGAWQRRRDE
jgi:hypothetical protein